MGFLLKAGLLGSMDSIADVRRLMKNDLKNNADKKGVKFVAAKNFLVGGKPMNLFIVTDAPATFDAVLKKQPKAPHASGTCDITKTEGKVQVVVKKATGRLAATAVADMVGVALGSDPSITAISDDASVPHAEPTKP